MTGEFCGIAGGCDVRTQAPCPDGQGCYYTYDGTTSETVCAPHSAGVVGAACTAPNDCGPGLGCFNERCTAYCCAATDCEGGAVCERASPVEGNPLGFCRSPDECDPIAQTGCDAGESCGYNLMLRDGTTQCDPAGTAAVGAACSMERCVVGAECLRVGPMGMEGPATCYAWCRTDGDPCAAGFRCSPIGMGVVYGVCLPMM